MLTKKEKYNQFIKNVYVPIYSQPWWLDALCGEDNWDVWLYYSGDEVTAAMPYYKEMRGDYKYITKALLTQNNGIIFRYTPGIKNVAKQKYEEKVIDAACKYIKELDVDVYEQQYHYSFENWLPFFWNRYQAMTRYTFIFENTKDLDAIWGNISSKYRSKIKKGQRNSRFSKNLDKEIFYREHEKIFLKQNLNCPFSYEQWEKLYDAVVEHEAGEIIYAENAQGQITSLMFLVWDDESIYQLLAGSMPEFQKLDTYDALIWEGIKIANEKGLKYDFEGSVIKRISKSFREFGAKPMPYFRIRKVFNYEIAQKELKQQYSK